MLPCLKLIGRDEGQASPLAVPHRTNPEPPAPPHPAAYAIVADGSLSSKRPSTSAHPFLAPTQKTGWASAYSTLRLQKRHQGVKME